MTTEFVNQFSFTETHPEFNASLSSLLSLTNGRNELKAMTRHTAWQRGAPAMIGSVHVHYKVVRFVQKKLTRQKRVTMDKILGQGNKSKNPLDKGAMHSGLGTLRFWCGC